MAKDNGLPFCFNLLKQALSYKIDTLLIKTLNYNDLIALIIELSITTIENNAPKNLKATQAECDKFL